MTRTSFPPRRNAAALALASAAALAGCAGLNTAPAASAAALPAQWQAPLPHGGQVGDLKRWWQQFNDPLLVQLIDAGQQASPSIAAARSRIEQARATRVASGAALLPSLDAGASVSRGRLDLSTPVGTSASASLQAGWEPDVFGANRAGADAAQARLEGSEAAWHDARVSVAAEIASTYLALRACEAQVAQTQLDATSRAETARLTDLAAKAGFQPPASAELARASAAQGSATLTQQRAQCDLTIKALVALTAQPEAALRQQLAASTATLPQPAQIGVTAVPADALAQRPDLLAAARDVTAASADATQAQAQRYPRVSLAGSIGPARFETGGIATHGTLWSLGPVSVSLPIFDGGRRRANAEAARARYDAATLSYAASLRQALREVEEALVALQSTAARNEDARVAAEGFERSYRATESRFKGGVASLFELEDARRSMVAAQSALIDLQRERVAAWISLYRALGGGWTATDSTPQSSTLGAGPSAPQG
jgi:NodT family efflux transporter outer membrane factor (OMF) lipoprotein